MEGEDGEPAHGGQILLVVRVFPSLEVPPERQVDADESLFLVLAQRPVGQYQPAVNDFTKAIDLDAEAIYGWRMRGRAYYFLNQFDNAMSDLQAALRIDPKDNSTLTFINDLKRKRGR